MIMKRSPIIVSWLHFLLLARVASGWSTMATPSRRGFLVGGAGGLATMIATSSSFPAEDSSRPTVTNELSNPII
jgi:hypothetical protein